jgi:SAM-dependent methyltransferase
MWAGDAKAYFDVGAGAMACLQEAAKSPPRSVLDLPCGHGRVLRFLKAAWPDARFVASDLDASGVEFCASTFGVEGVVSVPDLDELQLGRRFDVQWCGSLVTHFDDPAWSAALRFFRRHVEDGGVLVFTTHGAFSAELMSTGEIFHPALGSRYGFDPAAAEALIASFERTGFAFSRYPTTPDSPYGHSMATTEWVTRRAEETGWTVESSTHRGWADHHDIHVCRPT